MQFPNLWFSGNADLFSAVYQSVGYADPLPVWVMQISNKLTETDPDKRNIGYIMSIDGVISKIYCHSFLLMDCW